MIRRKLPIELHFDTSTEYSIDNGDTWTVLPADTKVEIQTDNKVQVRTAENLTNLSKMDFKIRKYEYVNIKNAKSITDASNMFYNSDVNRIRVSNNDNISNARYMFFGSVCKEISIGDLPNVTDMYAFMHKTFAKKFSGVEIGKSSAEVSTIKHSFSYMHDMKIMGDIKIPNPNIVDQSYIFSYSKIDMFPHIDIVLQTTDNVSYVYSGIGYLNSAYIPYGKIKSTGSNDYDFLSNSSSSLSFMNSTNVSFSGLDLFSSGSYLKNYTFYNSSKLHTPFSRLVKFKDKFGVNWDAGCSAMNSDITAQDIIEMETNDAPCNVEVPNWMPDVEELLAIPTTNVAGSESIGCIGNDIVLVSNGTIKRTSDLGYDFIDYSEDVHGYQSDNVSFARNGNYAVADGEDIKMINDSGLVLAVITPDDYISFKASVDGSLLYVLSGGTINTENGTVENVSNSVDIYNFSTGNKISDITISNNDNQCAIDIYSANSEYNPKILKSTYVVDGSSKTLSSSSVESVTVNGVKKKEVILSSIVDYLAPNYYEDNEFVAIDRGTGTTLRCFGK